MDREPERIARADEADCTVDLKLGGLGGFGAAEKWEEQAQLTMMASSSSPSKKPRHLTTASPSNALLCSVDGCSSDLRRCKEYHRRHKVCEAHSKTPVVTVGGVEQRFCQQCSRFHLLAEFDDVKRSCRKRLDGHNRRRRKPQSESNNSTVLFQYQQGRRFSGSPYTSQIPPTDRSLLPFIDGEQNFPGCRFPLSQDGQTSFAAAAVRPPAQSILKTVAPTESSSNRVFSDGSSPQVLDSNCAHSLLSLPVQTASSNVGQLFPADNRMSIGQSLVSSLRYPRAIGSVSVACSQIENERACGVLVSDAEAVDQRCQALFQEGGHGSSDGGSKSLPFSWH